MTRVPTLAAAGLLLTGILASAEAAPRRAVMAIPPPPAGLDADEVRDYWQDQAERRHEMERAALRMEQRAELRARGLDDDDDD